MACCIIIQKQSLPLVRVKNENLNNLQSHENNGNIHLNPSYEH